MKTTPATPGILWRGRVWRISGGAIDAPVNPATQRIMENLQTHFSSELRDLEGAAAIASAALAKLNRADGTPVYAAQEAQERREAILVAFDVSAGHITSAAEAAIAESRDALARLEGVDPLDALSEAELSRAALAREFVAEDVRLLPPGDLVTRVRAILSRGDKAQVALYQRYVGQAVDEAARAGRSLAPDLLEVNHALRQAVANPKLAEQQQAAARRLSAAQVLGGEVQRKRREIDGRHEQALAEMRQRLRF